MADEKQAQAAPQPPKEPTVTTAAPYPQHETIEGGKFLNAQGVLVNANGEPIDDKGNVKKADG